MAYTKKYFEVVRQQAQLKIALWDAVEKVAPDLTIEQVQHALLEEVYYAMTKKIFRGDKTLINDKYEF
jgi:hypothetical protein